MSDQREINKELSKQVATGVDAWVEKLFNFMSSWSIVKFFLGLITLILTLLFSITFLIVFTLFTVPYLIEQFLVDLIKRFIQ